ncbi:phage tail tape measure protein [Pseudomonas donghuensis]|uniref:phage tail tape measure protein n=1 Tax=Pseudomonas donghuensis TaxID=1163398 RepID=UPI000C2B40A5|nr:phage tail tape measure protein [Pseudomonas donghuensis]PJY97699.1 phage tail tape measure protein [Pseudomonas donghuensis]WKY26965.1 phage tail tape measure protein [Pseudomonas donghuensis]
MSSKLSLGLVIGGAVSATVRSAFTEVQGHIKKLEEKGNKAKVLKSTIGETIRLREEWKKAHDSGSASASGLLRKLEGNLDSLRKQGVAVGKLNQEYQRLGRTAKATDLQVKGQQQLEKGKAGLKSNVGQAVVGVGALGVAGKISADYQAIIRDIAIKADVANKPQEAEMTRTVIQTAQDTGMARNDVADLVNQLVGAGMDLSQALSYAPVAAKFAIGQGASGVDTASMIMALQQNAKITDPKVMQQALEAIALQGQAGSFEAADMARWFPQLLAGMEKNGSTGMDAVSSLGAMLQVQMKTAGGSDEAANNLKNWMEKIGSGEVVKAYKDAGIDYQASLNTGIQKGMSTLESSFDLAMKYIQATDPAKAAKMAEAQAKISKETDPEKAKAMLNALEQSLRTGDIFADMQVKAALTAYAANRGLYEQLKKDSQSAAGILDKNLAERRETSAQMWAETGQSVDDAMRSIGDAIRPATDLVATGIKKVAQGLTSLSDGAQSVVLGITAAGAAFIALKTVLNGLKVARGLANIGRGTMMERGGSRRLGGVVDAVTSKGRTGNKSVDSGMKLLGGLLGASDDADGGSNTPQRVFVVNADAFGGVGATASSAGPGTTSRRRRGSRRRGANSGGSRRRLPASKSGAPARTALNPVAPAAPTVRATSVMPKAMAMPAPAIAADIGSIGRMAKSARDVTKFGKRLPGGAVIDAGLGVIDTALNAETQDEKAEGYGSAAGGLAGSLAGAAAGAAIGSVIPGIGTVIGGAVGAIIGGMGGESLGGMLGKSWFGSDDKETAVARKSEPDKPSPTGVVAPVVAGGPNVPGDVVRSMAVAPPPPAAVQAISKAAEPPKAVQPQVDQRFTWSPNFAVAVHGDVKDPSQMARDLAPHLRPQFEEFARQFMARQLFDAPHV